MLPASANLKKNMDGPRCIAANSKENHIYTIKCFGAKIKTQLASALGIIFMRFAMFDAINVCQGNQYALVNISLSKTFKCSIILNDILLININI